MRVSKFKQSLARFLVMCLLMCDTMPVYAQTATGDASPQNAVVAEQSIGTTDGNVSTGDVSNGDVSNGDVSTGDVSNGDVSNGDVSNGDVSTGDIQTGLHVEKAIRFIDPYHYLAEVVKSATLSIADEEGNDKETFTAYSDMWYEKGMQVSVTDEWGNDVDLQWGIDLFEDDVYNFHFYSEKDESLSCQWEVVVVARPEVGVGEEYSFTNWYASDYIFRPDEKGFYKLSVPEGKMDISVYKQGYFQVQPGKNAYLAVTGSSKKFSAFGDTDPSDAAEKFTVSEVALESLKMAAETDIVLEYGTWGYSVATGSAYASGNNPVSGNRPIRANYQIGKSSNKNYAVAIQLDMTAKFDDNGEINVSNYNNYRNGDYAYWQAMGITQRLTKADGSVVTTDATGYLPEGDYKLTYTTSDGVSVDVPFSVAAKKEILPTGVELSSPGELEVGDRGTFVASVLPATANTKTELTWTSSNSKVLEVRDGRYIAQKAGTATITVKTANGKKDSIKVTVIQGNSPYYLYLHPNMPGRNEYRWLDCYYGETYNLADKGYTRTGYTMKGWNTRPDGKGKFYALDAEVKNLTTEYGGDVHFYAQWTPNSYQIEFESGVEGNTGVKGSMKNQKFIYDKAAALSANAFKRDGYDFAGWVDANGNYYSNKQKIVNLVDEANGVVVLKAMWKPTAYKITYKNAETGKNGVVNNPNPATYYKDSETIQLNNPVRPGYEFGGWFKKSSMKEADKITAIDTTKGGNVTVYAKWIGKTTTIKFNANMPADAPEGTAVKGTMKDLAVSYGKTKALTKNAYKIDGYVFTGWSTSPDGAGAVFSDKATIPYYIFDMAAQQDNVITLYAKWDYVQYKITYVNAEDGKKSVTNNNACSYIVTEKEITLENPSRTGFVFDGWYTKSSMKEADKIQDNILRIAKPGNIKVYAKWTAKKTTIHFNSNFPEGVTGNGTMKDLVATAGKTKNLPKNGLKVANYTFVGWSNLPEGEGDTAIVFKDKASLDHYFFWWYEEITLYAQWELTEYPITYVNAIPGKNGVTVNYNQESFNVKDEDFVLSAPERPGYDFVGWYSKSSMKEADKITSVKINDGKAIKIYAKWAAHQSMVHFESNRPVYAAAEAVMKGTMKDTKVIYGKTKSLAANQYKLTGYTFAGWNTQADGSGTTYANKATITSDFVAKENVVLYAQWTPVKYKISYPNAVDGKDGVSNANPTYYTSEHTMISQSGMTGASVLVLTSANKIGYSFGGWFTDKACKEDFFAISTMKKKPLTLYAKWWANNYYIAYNANAADATGKMDTVQTTYDQSLYLSANRFVREGYVFAGWSTVPEPGEGDVIYANMEQVKNLTAEYYGTVTLYAQWVAID